MKIQNQIQESLVGKSIELNAQELIVLASFIEEIKSIGAKTESEHPGIKQPIYSREEYNHARELLDKVCIFFLPIVDSVQGLEEAARALFEVPKELKEYSDKSFD
jgi:hypothetical protein